MAFLAPDYVTSGGLAGKEIHVLKKAVTIVPFYRVYGVDGVVIFPSVLVISESCKTSFSAMVKIVLHNLQV